MGHYTKLDLDRYLNGDMNTLAKFLCRHHLRHCYECGKLLEELRSDNDLSRELRLAAERKQQAEKICNGRGDKTVMRLEEILK